MGKLNIQGDSIKIIQKYKTIVNDDDTPLDESKQNIANEICKKIVDSKVLGDNTPVNRYTQLRIAQVFIEYIQEKDVLDCFNRFCDSRIINRK